MNELFGDNRTKLASVTEAEVDIPIMPGVSAATGLYEAMMDSAKSDLAIFEAMMKMDALELKMRREGTFNEGAADTIKKGASKIITNIINGLKKLASWIKTAISAFTLAILKKLDNDKLLVAKYKKALENDKENVERISIQWRDVDLQSIDNATKSAYAIAKTGFHPGLYDKELWTSDNADENFWNNIGNVNRQFMESIINKGSEVFFKTQETRTTIGKVGGITKICQLLEAGLKNDMTNLGKDADTVTKLVEEEAKWWEPGNNKITIISDTEFISTPDMLRCFTLFRQSTTSVFKAAQDAFTYYYKENKAAFMKAVGAVAGVKNEAALDSFIEEEMNDIDAVLADTTSDEVIEILNKQTSMDTEMDDDEIGVEEPKEETPAEEPSYTAEEAAFFEAPLF